MRMALLSSGDDHTDDTAMSFNHEDESFTNLLSFVDVASSRIRQALDRPRSCRRRVNHRKYLARILTSLDVTAGSTRNDHVSERRRATDESPAINQSKRRLTQSVRRCCKARTMRSAVGEGSRSFSAGGRQHSDHINGDELTSLGQLDNDVGGYELLETGQTRCWRPPASSSLQFNEPAATVPATADVSLQARPDWLTSTVNDGPHHSWFSHPPAVHLPQQSRPNLELAAWYQTGFRQPSQCNTAAVMRHDENYSSFVRSSDVPCGSSAHRQTTSASAFDVDELLNLPSSSWRYEHNVNEFYRPSYWTTSSVTPSPPSYNDVWNLRDITDLMLQQQQSPTSNFNIGLPCSTPVAINLFQPLTTDVDYCNTLRGENHFVDTSPSSFNDSGLGSTSVESAADVDGSGSIDSSFFWPTNYGFCPLQSTETFDTDCVCMQTAW